MTIVIMRVNSNEVLNVEVAEAFQEVLDGKAKFLPDGLVDGTSLNALLFNKRNDVKSPPASELAAGSVG